MRAWIWVGLAAIAAAACGDTVVDEGEGEGGKSSTTSSGTLATPTGTTSGVGTPSGTGGSTSTGTGTIACDQFCAECDCTCGDTVSTKIANFCSEFEDQQCNEAGDTWECVTVAEWMTGCDDEC